MGPADTVDVAGPGPLRRARPVPDHGRPHRRLRGPGRARARRRRAARGGGRPPGPDPAAPARASSEPTSASAPASASACPWASAGRTPRSSPRATSTSARSRAASSASRRTPRPPAPAPGPADARAAHPPRQGHQQHLHGPGAAGRDGQHVRRLPRAGRAVRDRAARPPPDRASSPPACAGWASTSGRAPFFDTLRVRVGARAADVLAAARARRINLRDYGDGSLGISLDETTLEKDLLGRCGTSFAGGRDAGLHGRRAAGGRGRGLRRALPAHQPVPRATRSSTGTTRSTRCSATSTACRRATSRSRRR